MWRLLAAIFMLNILFFITDGIYDNGGGVQATELTSAITTEATTIPVVSTVGYASGNKTVTVGLEDIFYISKDDTNFYTLESLRGYNDTIAAEHNTGDLVYTKGAAMVNDLSQFEIASTGTESGDVNVVTTPIHIFTHTLGQMFSWDYTFLSGDFAIVKTILIGLSALVTILFALQGLGTATSIRI